MRITIFLVFVSCMAWVQCKDNSIIDFIPGTYCAHWKTNFSEVRDTLQISSMVQDGLAGYQIVRRMHVDYFRKHEPEYRLEHWIGIWNANTRLVIVQSNGRVLSFDPRNKILVMGITSYQKL